MLYRCVIIACYFKVCFVLLYCMLFCLWWIIIYNMFLSFKYSVIIWCALKCFLQCVVNQYICCCVIYYFTHVVVFSDIVFCDVASRSVLWRDVVRCVILLYCLLCGNNISFVVFYWLVLVFVVVWYITMYRVVMYSYYIIVWFNMFFPSIVSRTVYCKLS